MNARSPSTYLKFPNVGLFLIALLYTVSGCKPAPPSVAASQPSPPPVADSTHPPTAEDFRAFFEASFPSALKVTEVKSDPPVRQPNTSPTSNAWLLSVKVVFTPTEDLLALPSSQDGQAIDNLVGELNRLIHWRNDYARLPYAKACGLFEVHVPAAPVPQLLVVLQLAGKPLPALYGKVSAEWQVDHWQFTNQSLSGLPTLGEPRSSYKGVTMVQGSPEAEKALREVRDAITQARKDIDAVRGKYAEQVTKGVQPGTTYMGTVSYGGNAASCELRFLDPPDGSNGGSGGDTHFASFQVSLLSQNPVCWYQYKARVSTELPLPVPSQQPSTAVDYMYARMAASSDPSSGQSPVYNVFQNLVRSSHYNVGRETLASYLSNNDHGGQGLLLLDGRIEGALNDFGRDGIHLSVHQKP